MYLLDPSGFDLDQKKIGTVMGYIVTVQAISKMILTPIYGYLYDKIGRRRMIMIGGFVLSFSYALIPL